MPASGGDERVEIDADPEAQARSEFLWRLLKPIAPTWRVERREAQQEDGGEPAIEGLEPRAALAIVTLWRAGALPEGVRQPLYRIYGGIEATARTLEPLS